MYCYLLDPMDTNGAVVDGFAMFSNKFSNTSVAAS